MKRNIKYIGLVMGITSVIISFLFFGRNQALYQRLLTGGFLTALVFYMTILVSKEKSRTKFLWTMVVIGSIGVQLLTEPLLIKTSYQIYLSNHREELNEANRILEDKEPDISVYRDEILDEKHQLTVQEKKRLNALMKDLGTYLISRSDYGIHFELWGFLDVQLGITYWTNETLPDSRYKKFSDNWYH